MTSGWENPRAGVLGRERETGSRVGGRALGRLCDRGERRAALVVATGEYEGECQSGEQQHNQANE